MMAKIIKGRVQHPAYTAAALKAKNPVLLKGEIVYESDTTLHKVGDGKTPWNTLAYARGGDLRTESRPNRSTRIPPADS